jgi:hypothetical protein
VSPPVRCRIRDGFVGVSLFKPPAAGKRRGGLLPAASLTSAPRRVDFTLGCAMRRTDLALAPAWRSSARPLVSRRPPLTGPDQACMDAEAGSLVNAYTPYRLQSQ